MAPITAVTTKMQNIKLMHSVLMERFTIFQSRIWSSHTPTPTMTGPGAHEHFDAMMVAELLDTKPSPARIDATKSSVLYLKETTPSANRSQHCVIKSSKEYSVIDANSLAVSFTPPICTYSFARGRAVPHSLQRFHCLYEISLTQCFAPLQHLQTFVTSLTPGINLSDEAHLLPGVGTASTTTVRVVLLPMEQDGRNWHRRK
jgi:hypothetical protein